MKLFAFYIGGSTETSLIELHDVRIMAGKSMTACHDRIRASWWGKPKSLHLDCWGEITSIDGYDVSLSSVPDNSGMHLWFVNLGGYVPGVFDEAHRNVFIAAPNASKAKVAALKQILDWPGRHMDYMLEVEMLTDVSALIAAEGLHIRLTPNPDARMFTFTQGYKPLGEGRG